MKKLPILMLLFMIATLQSFAITQNSGKLSSLNLKNVSKSLTPKQANNSEATRFRMPAGKFAAPENSSSVGTGHAVMTYKTLSTSLSYDGGCGVVVETDQANADTYIIKNFYDKGINVTVKVNKTDNTVTVANQQITTVEGYRVDIAVCTPNGAPDYTTPIIGTLGADGSIHLETWWGLYIREGEYADSSLGWFYDTNIQPANATMTEELADGSGTETYGVVVSQNQNVLTVNNFANHGYPVKIVLQDDKGGTIDRQTVYKHVSQGDVLVAGYTAADNSGTINLVIPIQLNKATDSKSVSWNNWTIYSANGYFNLWKKGTINVDFDLLYPTLVENLTGEGTEASPYLIKNIDELNYLARQCREDKTSGVYYALGNNIDMKGYQFTPIGTKELPFKGVLDGKGFTISNLSIDGGSTGYAGLIGVASAESVLKNINLEKPQVTSSGRYTAALAGESAGKVINCHVNQGTIGSNYAYVAGLVAGAAEISNCSVRMSQIVGLGGYVAGLASVVSANVADCYVSDVFVYAGSQGDSPSGGLVALALSGSSITDSHFAGLLSGSPSYTVGQTLGGIIGSGADVKIARCFSVASISGYTNSARTGGIAGVFSGEMTDCYTAGNIDASSSAYTGGLVGYITSGNTTIKNCYTSASVNPAVGGYDKTKGCRELVGNYTAENATYENVWFDSQMTSAVGSAQNGKTTAELTSATGISGFDSNTWVFTESVYPRLKKQVAEKGSDLSATAILFAAKDNLQQITTNTEISVLGSTLPAFISGNKYVVSGKGADITKISENKYNIRLNNTFASDSLTLINGNAQYVTYIAKFAPKMFSGEGTAESPYLINNKEDLCKLAEITSLQNQPFNGSFFKMTADIDMSGVENFQGIGNVAWSKTVTFGGTFDGDGHAIHNLKMGGLIWTTKPANEDEAWTNGVYQATGQPAFRALFGTINGLGSVKNLTIAEDCQIDGGNYVAGIAISNNGKIENCRNYARIRALQEYAGGIAINNNGHITNCLNAGDVMVNGSYAAGIVVYNYSFIRKVMNVGNISAKTLAKKADDTILAYAGGIASYTNGLGIYDAVNAGTIYTQKGECGGIVAFNPKYGDGKNYNGLVNVINYGVVNGATPTITGAIVGSGSTEGKVEKAYWDSQIITIMPEANGTHQGMEGLTTAALTSGTAPEGFDTDVWQFTAGAYPVMKNFADDPIVKAASTAVVTLASDQTARNITSAANLSTAEGLVWKLNAGTAFSIADNKLTPPTEVKTYVSDVLIATNGKYSKSISIASSPALALTGAGTEEDPYQLKTAEDWNAWADYIRVTKNDMQGCYIKFMNDIDFTGKEFRPVAIGGNIFNGHLLGNGKKLANVTHSFVLALNADGATISNSGGKQGSIGILGAFGSISDLTISGEFTQNTATYAGVFVGQCYGKVVNCVNEATLTGSRAYRAGIAAIAYEGAQFIDCKNRGTITGTGTAGYAAGIVSEVVGPSSFIRCGNEGQIYGPGTYSAGVVGTAVPSEFIECYNTADILNPVSFFAGILAYANGNATYAGRRHKMERCYNTGNITSKGNVGAMVATTAFGNCAIDATGCWNTGTIKAATVDGNNCVGTAAGMFCAVGGGSNIVDCWNSGNVYVLDNDKGSAAGFAKDVKGGSEALPTRFTRCVNKGEVKVASSMASGLILQPAAWVVIDSCENTGNVTSGTFLAAGIVANTYSQNLFIKNTRNLGNITVGTNTAGGILANSQSAIVYISDCVNFGNVTTADRNPVTKVIKSGSSASGDGGYTIGGIAGNCGGVITRCYNVGEISGTKCIGGILGLAYGVADATKANTKIYDSYNMGKVISWEENQCGAIVGSNAEVSEANTTGNYWSENVVIKNVHYLNTSCETTLKPAGTAVSNKELAALDLGEGWQSADDYSYPVLTAHNGHELAHLHSATVVLSDGDDTNNVTKDFKVGCPAGVNWTASTSDLAIEGNDVVLKNNKKGNVVTLTATCGEYSKSYELTINMATSGVDSYTVDDIVEIKYLDINGIGVNADTLQRGVPYIKLTIYNDGKAVAEKFIK